MSLDALTPRERFIVQRHLLDGATLAVVAEEFQNTISKVREYEKRALIKLGIPLTLNKRERADAVRGLQQ